MIWFGVSGEGRRICIDNAFTINVPYGAAYQIGDEKNMGEGPVVGNVILCETLPNGYRDGSFDLVEKRADLKFSFTRTTVNSSFSFANAKRSKFAVMTSLGLSSSQRELYSDSEIIVVRGNNIESPGVDAYGALVILRKAVYICSAMFWGEDVAASNAKADKLLSSIRVNTPVWFNVGTQSSMTDNKEERLWEQYNRACQEREEKIQELEKKKDAEMANLLQKYGREIKKSEVDECEKKCVMYSDCISHCLTNIGIYETELKKTALLPR